MADALIAIIAAAVFIAGIVLGVFVMVSIGIRREERDFSRTGQVSFTRRTTRLANRGARVVTGLYVRRPSDSAARPRQNSGV